MAKAGAAKGRKKVSVSKHSLQVRRGSQDLSKHFGRCVANHRRRLALTQQQLAEQADISTGMVAKIESGASGVRFPMVVKLAIALDVPPVELFDISASRGKRHQGTLKKMVVQLETLGESELEWLSQLVAAALKQK